jgi:hypothetical protein
MRRRTPKNEAAGGRRWYLLIHQLPPEPLYLRAKIRQRLARVGAIALKNAVYVLPLREESLEDFQWIAEEAVSGGGEAHVCEARFAERATDERLITRFRQERDADYTALAESIDEWIRKAGRGSALAPPQEDLPSALSRARRRMEEITRVDYFQAAGRGRAEKSLQLLQARAGETRSEPRPGRARTDLVGRTWVTRRGVQVDRIASAWLIRRFLDPKARFRFVDPGETPKQRELRFDMVGGEFTHEGDACTFETLISRTGLSDPALRAVAEIVHDIDVKDGKFGRPEARGIDQVLQGLFLAHARDEERLDRGFALFDGLYESFRGRASGKEVRK